MNKEGNLDGIARLVDHGYILEVSFKNGKLHGPFVSYHGNGKPFRKTTYNYGKLQGLYFEYYKNGNLSEKSTYQNDKLHGPYLEYYKNGCILQYVLRNMI